MIYGKQNIKQWFEMQGKPYFSIFRKGATESGNFVFTNRDKENEDITSATVFLDRCLSLLGSGDFFIFCNKDQSASSKGRSETFFSISLNEAGPVTLQQNTQPAINGFDAMANHERIAAEADKIATKKFEDLMTQYELKKAKEQIAELQRDNKELQQKVSEPWNKVIETVHPYIGSIVEQMGFKRAPLPISGIEHDNHVDEHTETIAAPQMSQDEQQRMNETVHSFCEALHAQYPDTWLTIIEKLTSTIKRDPAKIDMALKFL